MRIKGTTLRSYINVVSRLEHRAAIVAQLPPDTAALLSNPPLPGTWSEWRHIQDITVAVEIVDGLEGVRRLADGAIEEAKRPYVRVLEGLIRLFGTSPATIYKRMNDLVKNAVENMQYTYRVTSDRSGTMEVSYGGGAEIPLCMFVGGRASLVAVLDACGVKGAVSEPERLGPTRTAYQIRWQ
jgi:hypothetical protein